MADLVNLTRAEPKRDRYGRPLIVPRGGGKPKAYTRPTTIADTLDDRHNLELWMQRQVLLGTVARPDLHALAATTDATDKAALNKLCSQLRDAAASDAGANMGTAVHAAVESWIRDDTYPPMFEKHIEAFKRLLDLAGLVADANHVEQFVVNEVVGSAGTFDMRLHHKRTLANYIGDLKTGATVEWSARAFSVQLAQYADATSYYDWDTETHSDPAPVDKSKGVIVHLPAHDPEAGAIYWIDLDAGREALERALWVREWRKRKGILVPFENDGGGTSTTEAVEGTDTGTVDRPDRGSRLRPTPQIPTQTSAPAASPWPDEGAVVDELKMRELADKVKAAGPAAATVKRWARQCIGGTVHSWSVSLDDPATWTQRRHRIGLTALQLATAIAHSDDDAEADDIARQAIAIVIGDGNVQRHLVGELLGTLDADECRRLYKLAPTLEVKVDDSGVLKVVAA